MGLNIIIKAIGAVCIIAGTTLLGRAYAGMFKERCEFLSDFLKRLEILKNEIGFMKGILADAFLKSGEFKGRTKDLFDNVALNLEDMDAQLAWETACDKYLPIHSLKKDDSECIKSLGRLLGVSDVDGQISNIDAVSTQLGALSEAAQAERKKNESLFKSVGPLAGIGIAVLLI